MPRFFLIASTLCIAGASTMLRAQIIPSRNMLVVPMAPSGVTGFLTGTVFFGEMQRGFGSAGDDRAWNAVFGGSVELYRWDSTRVLVTRFAHAMLANALNDISFNPRSAMWEENIGFVSRVAYGLGELGLTYRCKHDIDNSDPPNSDIPRDSGPAEKRVLILGGLYATWLPYRVQLAPLLDLRAFLRADVYLLREDNRFPANSAGSSWSHTTESIIIGTRVDWQCTPVLAAYTRDMIAVMAFSRSEQSAGVDGRAEAGMHFTGIAGGIDAYVAWEHLFDDLSEPIPRSSNVVSAGVRIVGAGVF